MTHPNVVHIERFYDNDPKYFYMVLELMAGGELFDRIVQKVSAVWHQFLCLRRVPVFEFCSCR